ncbi:cobalt-zinc-cadmium resistance protein CzcD [alpha proteobacterium U9-1i]|nr:cobalt-zinc-cadmium resistance protein CzcD [alpha proteobacterium U9-1i]
MTARVSIRLAPHAILAHIGAMHGAHSHAHGPDDNHHHGHAHSHHDHGQHAPPPSDKRYIIAIALNLGFVVLEAGAGFVANSTALLSDAAHNLSDVLGLGLAGFAAWLAGRAASAKRTYGYSKATVLAALANAVLLFVASGMILWEALSRFAAPEPVQSVFVMGVAAAGVVINGATALLFVAGRHGDVNARGAFLHMAADAGVSAAVIIAGALMLLTSWTWIDPAVSVAVVALIVWSTWGLLRESLDLALDAAPKHIDVGAVRDALAGLPGVIAVHDLHVWAMSAQKTALTAHLVRPDGGDDAFLIAAAEAIEQRFGIGHVTLQVERAQRDDCVDC